MIDQDYLNELYEAEEKYTPLASAESKKKKLAEKTKAKLSPKNK